MSPTNESLPEAIVGARALLDQVGRCIEDLADYAPSAGDDAVTVDLIAGLETLKRAAEGAQTAMTADFVAVARDRAERAGVPVERRSRGLGEQIALARRESPHRGRQLVALAVVLPLELPHTYRALRQGRITGWHATVLARETAHVDLTTRRGIDKELAAELDSSTPTRLAGRARSLADQADPVAAVRRRRNAEADRHVTLRPAPDTMTWLTALLPVKDGVAAYAALVAAAGSARAAGDQRSKGQVMADALAGRIVHGEGDQPETLPVRVDLLVSDQTLFGTEESPAWLEHYGPVPAELARDMVVDASAASLADLRRVYADDHGHLVALDSISRFFPTGLADLIRLRDQVCRTPWCDAPIRHTDHLTPRADGGTTSLENGQGLCEACNHAKQATGWRHRLIRGPDDDWIIETTTPTGHQYPSWAPTTPEPAHHGLRLDIVLAA